MQERINLDDLNRDKTAEEAVKDFKHQILTGKQFWEEDQFIPFSEWVEHNFFDPTTVNMFGKNWDYSNARLLKLHPIQKRICDVVLTPSKEGIFPYETVVYSTIKKEGKTTLAGAVGAWWGACIEPTNLILCLANDQEQSAGRIFGAMLPTLEALGCRVPKSPSSKPEIRLPNGSVIQAIANNYAGNAGANYGLTLWCLDQETEVLTNNGWRKYDTIQVEDLIATRDKDGFLEYQKANDCFISPYTGKMHRLKHRRADMLVTPNHRMYGEFYSSKKEYNNSELGFLEAKDACKKRAYIVKADITGYNGFEHHTVDIEAHDGQPQLTVNADAWFEFLGYYISEGCYRHKAPKRGIINYSVFVSQSKEVQPENYEKIRDCINRLGFTDDQITFKPDGMGIKSRQIANFCSKLGPSRHKHVPRNMLFACNRQLRLLFDALILGTGSKVSDGLYGYTTTSKQLADDVCEIGLKLGFIPKLCKRRRAINKRREIYRITLSSGKIQANSSQWSEEDYDSIVWCPSTDNGIIYVRRNGMSCWTGNSELWAYTSERSRRLYDELVPVPTKKNSLRWIETYVGFKDESDLLLSLFNRIFKDTDEKEIQPGAVPVPGLEDIESEGKPCCWHIPEEGLFYFHNHSPFMGPIWSGIKEYESFRTRQKADLRPTQYTRLWENRWQESEGNFIDHELYDDAITLKGPTMEPMVLAGDASQRNDSTVLVGTRKYTAIILGKEQERYKLCYVKIWDPKIDGLRRANSMGGKRGDIDLDETIADEVESFYSRGLMIGPFRYDPYQLHQVAINLRKRGVPCVEFSQHSDRLIADTNLGNLLRKGLLDMYYHPVLEAHIKNSKVRETENQQVRIVKGTHSRSNKVDGAVALSMSLHAAETYRPQTTVARTSSKQLLGNR